MKYQLVNVYARHGALFIVPSVRDYRGLQTHADPAIQLQSETATPEEVGKHIRWVNVSATAEPKPNRAALLEKAGQPTWSAFMEGARLCIVQVFDASLELRTTENDGKGFKPLSDVQPVVLRKDVDNETLGKAVLEVLERSL